MDRHLIARGLDRTSFWRFSLWILPWAAILASGAYAAGTCLVSGLNRTNMDNRFAFGLWIFLDLTIIAFGAGAFFTGFLLYVLRRKQLKSVINSAVVVGLACYSGAVAVLAVDVGQPLRAWFTFWHPNVHSMLTEVTFCISCYLCVLLIEYLPLLLKNRKLRRIPSFLLFEFEMHRLMYVLAGVGTFLSFFHQGSLGGLYGVLQGRPFAFREGIAIWPSTFFLFILSAMAVGPCFLMLIVWTVSKLTKKTLVSPDFDHLLGRVSGTILSAYLVLKCVDTLIWMNRTAVSLGSDPFAFYAWRPFGSWILFTELIVCGLVPAVVLVSSRLRSRHWLLVAAAVLVCVGVGLNRFVMTIQTLALPTLPFDRFMSYWPSWQEVATFLAVIAYGVILYSFSYRYLNLFPEEKRSVRATSRAIAVPDSALVETT